jgi:hypothetical protein
MPAVSSDESEIFIDQQEEPETSDRGEDRYNLLPSDHANASQTLPANDKAKAVRKLPANDKTRTSRKQKPNDSTTPWDEIPEQAQTKDYNEMGAITRALNTDTNDNSYHPIQKYNWITARKDGNPRTICCTLKDRSTITGPDTHLDEKGRTYMNDNIHKFKIVEYTPRITRRR